MRPRTIGRALGIGVRVAGRIAGQCLAPSPPSASADSPARRPASATGFSGANRVSNPAPGRAANSPARSVRSGLGGFLRPFRRVGGILWLEVTGVFFLLPVVVFAPYLWRAVVDYPHSADHKALWVTAIVMAVFLYLGLSSFWRAGRRSRQD